MIGLVIWKMLFPPIGMTPTPSIMATPVSPGDTPAPSPITIQIVAAMCKR